MTMYAEVNKIFSIPNKLVLRRVTNTGDIKQYFFANKSSEMRVSSHIWNTQAVVGTNLLFLDVATGF